MAQYGEWSEEKVGTIADGLNQESAGKALFELVASCRKNGIDPETALRKFASSQADTLESTPLK